MSKIIDLFDIILDFIDNLLPGLIGYFSRIIYSTKNNIKGYTDYYKIKSSYIKLFYLIFIMIYLLFIFYIQKKTTIESSIYLKMISTIFNICLLTYSSINS